jgi:hypothetical protein
MAVTIGFTWEEFQELFAIVQDCAEPPPDDEWRWLPSIDLTQPWWI